jgi:hypothetical protein
MRMANSISIKASTEEVLAKLKENLKRHKELVAEAREGFVCKATEALQTKLDQLRSGKVISLAVELRPPQDYSHVYRVAIEALEMHQQPFIKLSGEQVRHLMMDDWEWMEHWLAQNAPYSPGAREYATRKHLTLGD